MTRRPAQIQDHSLVISIRTFKTLVMQYKLSWHCPFTVLASEPNHLLVTLDPGTLWMQRNYHYIGSEACYVGIRTIERQPFIKKYYFPKNRSYRFFSAPKGIGIRHIERISIIALVQLSADVRSKYPPLQKKSHDIYNWECIRSAP